MPTILELKEKKKVEATQRRSLTNTIARVRIQHSVGRIKLWRDAYTAIG